MADILVFDFDGTLMDTGEGIIEGALYSLHKHGLDDDPQEMRFFVGPPLLQTFMEHYGMDEAEAAQAVADYREYYRPIGIWKSHIYPGIPEMLRNLKAAGKKLAVATSKPLDMARSLLEREGALEFFDVTYGTSGKPKDDHTKAELIDMAREALDGTTENTLMVGDTKFDIAGAKAVNVRSVGVKYGYAAAGELEAAGADWIVDDVAGLEALLLKL